MASGRNARRTGRARGGSPASNVSPSSTACSVSRSTSRRSIDGAQPCRHGAGPDADACRRERRSSRRRPKGRPPSSCSVADAWSFRRSRKRSAARFGFSRDRKCWRPPSTRCFSASTRRTSRRGLPPAALKARPVDASHACAERRRCSKPTCPRVFRSISTISADRGGRWCPRRTTSSRRSSPSDSARSPTPAPTASRKTSPFFDRRRHRNIAVYPSDQKLATRSRFFSEDERVDYDVTSYDIETSFAPDRSWIDGTARVTLRTRNSYFSTLTLRLADSLVVRSVTSPQFGRLLHLRVVGQNNVLVGFPTTVVAAGGRRAGDHLRRAAAAARRRSGSRHGRAGTRRRKPSSFRWSRSTPTAIAATGIRRRR